MASSQHLIDFFDPAVSGRDPQGRTLKQILSWHDSELEYNHDYVQNVFPLPEGSMFNSAVWLVTAESYDAFRARPELRQSLDQAFSRICSFYGLKNEALSHRQITRGGNFESGRRFWLSRFNHNHLRITRIIRSLRVLGLPDQAAAFHHFLTSDDEVLAKTSPRSQMYWDRAARRPLHLPPENDDEEAAGITWLKGRE